MCRFGLSRPGGADSQVVGSITRGERRVASEDVSPVNRIRTATAGVLAIVTIVVAVWWWGNGHFGGDNWWQGRPPQVVHVHGRSWTITPTPVDASLVPPLCEVPRDFPLPNRLYFELVDGRCPSKTGGLWVEWKGGYLRGTLLGAYE